MDTLYTEGALSRPDNRNGAPGAPREKRRKQGMSETAEKVFTIKNKLGLHARAASQFVQVAAKYGSEVFVKKGEQEVNGKSIMGILILAAAKDSKITVRTEGDDADQALDALGELIDSGFGED